MNHISAERLALYLSGDIELEELRALEGHLRKCSKCRDLLTEFRGDLAALQASFNEPTADDLAAVRRGVIRRIEKRPRFAVRWKWAMTGAALTASVGGVMLLHSERPQKKELHRASATTAYLHVPYRPVTEVVIPNLKMARAHSRTMAQSEPTGIRSVTLLAEQDGPRILKMTTADPNVVILWQLGERTRRP